MSSYTYFTSPYHIGQVDGSVHEEKGVYFNFNREGCIKDGVFSIENFIFQAVYG